MAEEKPYQDIPMSDLRKHLSAISKAITDARKDLAQYQVTKANEDIYVHLKRAQDEIDVLIRVVTSAVYRVVNGQEIHGYTPTCYKIDKDYYGLARFGHTHCERIAQEQTSIPAEEFLSFGYRVPNNTICKGCGKPILPDPQNDEEA
jgi:hypothetical protein